MIQKSGRKIKVLLVVCNNVLNGTERYVVDLARNLCKTTFEVAVATPMKGPLSDILSENNIKEECYFNGKLLKYSFKGFWNISKILKREQYNVLHANAGIWPCVAAKLAGTKLIVETKHGIFYSDKKISNLPFLRKYYEISKQFFVDYFIAISENDKHRLINYFDTKKSKIIVIYNGVDIETVLKKVNGSVKYSKKSVFIVGNIGRFTFQKAQDILLEAVKILSEKRIDFKIVLIGAGEDEKMISDKISKLGISDYLIIEDYKKNIFNYISSLDALVLTSRFEGVPYVVLESMVLGVPVISTDVGGLSNFLTNEYNALITPVEDPQSTADAIEKLITNDKLRSDIIKNAAQTVKEYSIERMVRETSDFYIRNLN